MSFANIQFSAVRSNTESINCHSLVFTYFAGESWSFKRDIYLGIETLIGHNLFQVRANFIEIIPQYTCVPGASLLPDFFLDEFDNHTGGADVIKPDEPGKSGSGKIPLLFDRIGKHLSAELVSQAKAVYQFNVSGGHGFAKDVSASFSRMMSWRSK